MPETKPLYFKEFEDIVLRRFDQVDKKLNEHDKKFENQEEKFKNLEKKIEDEISNLEIITLRGFRDVDNQLDTIREDVSEMSEEMKKIYALIGRYEVRSANLEDILLKDFKVRLRKLEETILKIA